MPNQMSPDLDAALSGSGVLFKHLKAGDRFVFNKDDKDRPHCILVKTCHGYRHEVDGRQWKTGARTAVHPIPQVSTPVGGEA